MEGTIDQIQERISCRRKDLRPRSDSQLPTCDSYDEAKGTMRTMDEILKEIGDEILDAEEGIQLVIICGG